MELTLVLLASVLLGLLTRKASLSLLALPPLLLLGGLDQRILGLGAGLAVLLLGEVLQRHWGHPLVKLASISLAGVAAYHFGFRISFLTNPEGGFIYLSSLSLPLTLGWIIAVSYSLGMIGSWREGRTGLKVALLTAIVSLAVGLLQGQSLPFALALCAGLIGMLLGRLLRGRGIYAPEPEGVGFVLALISISGVLKTTASLALLGPLLSLGLPLWTTALPIAYGAQAQRAVLLRTLRRHGLAIYLLMSYFSLGAFLLRRPGPEGLLLFGGALPLGLLIWRWGRAAREEEFSVSPGQVRLLGVPLARLTLSGAVDLLEARLDLAHGRPMVIATPDTTALWRAQRDKKLREAYLQSDLVTADGAGLVWASRLLGGPLPERVTGIDMVEELCRRAAVRGCKLFLLGAAPGVAEEAKRRLEERFPGLKIVGTHHGFFGDGQEGKVLELINSCEPEVLLIGMGVPRQELWMVRNRDKLRVKVLIGVGGSLDVLSGRIPRAPRLLRQAGLEWLYRLVRQPRRIGRVLSVPLFILRVLLLEPEVEGSNHPGPS